MVIRSQKKNQTVHITRKHENCSNKDPAALGHYSALPQCSSGGWDGTPPDVGQRGFNKSQMCTRDMKILGQEALYLFKYEPVCVGLCANTLGKEVFKECPERNG